ncbi:MAG: hypothetical protein JW913_13935 [Chitinispirillaceae bacterium]|nr:hypothetical protein [Chitinispirillaceae bacterium]
MIRSLQKACIVSLILYLHASATLLPYPSPLPAVSTSYDTILLKTWQGIKKRLIDPYSIPFVHRPRSEEPHDAVSEGIGYGMILALYCNDQTYFNKIWDAGEQYMWDDNAHHYTWRVNQDGSGMGTGGAATDAEQDIALGLIFADGLVKKGIWSTHQSPKGADYAVRAQAIINNIWANCVEEGKYLRPGAVWGGRGFLNPGYFAPAFYRVFDEFEQESHNWSALIDQCYQTIAASPGFDNGIVPDWMQPDGKYASSDQLGYNAYAEGMFMYKDGIRALWRLATDCIWYNEPRAKQALDNAFAFIQTPDRANFFQMDGSLPAPTDSFKLGKQIEENKLMRPRREHSALTTGMWATAAMAAGGPQAAEPFSEELLRFYEGADYWGRSSDPDNEDTLHNEMYFDQFMAWFGASLISGVFTNLWEDFKDSLPEVAVALKDTPVVAPLDIDANREPLLIRALFTKPARWSVELRHWDIDTAAVQFTGSGAEVALEWSGTSADGKGMPQGAYRVTISARGMNGSYTKMVWLGRSLDLKSGSRLIIDNFIDGDLKPYFGSHWGSYTEQSDGKNGKTAIKRLAVASEETPPALHWAFRLDGSQQLGFNPYAALEWNCASEDSGFLVTGLDTLVFSARSSSDLALSVQFITSDIGDHTFFEDSVSLSTQVKEYCLAVKEFRRRLGGSGGSLDLSKCTAIRFQAQGPDGTENEIIMEKMLFAGNLASLYSSPPPYLPPEQGIGVHGTRRCAAVSIRTIRTPRSVVIELPSPFSAATLDIVAITGRRVKRILSANDQRVCWDFTGPDGALVPAACYIAVIRSGRLVYRVLLHHLP